MTALELDDSQSTIKTIAIQPQLQKKKIASNPAINDNRNRKEDMLDERTGNHNEIVEWGI